MSGQVTTQATPASAPHDWVDLAGLWPALVSGRAQIIESGSTPAQRYLRLAAASESRVRTRVPEHRIRMFERVLLGESQKVVALEAGCSTSTVATAVSRCLRAMGLNCRCSGIPALLVLLLHVLHGRTRRVALTVERLPDNAVHIVLGDRLENYSDHLSAGEAAVVRLLVEGKTHAEIARWRRTSTRTVANQIASVYRKLGVSGRMELLCHLIARIEPPSESRFAS